MDVAVDRFAPNRPRMILNKGTPGMPSLAGSFLVAKPELQDSNFHQTVVLLLQHGSEGAFGLVVNRPAKTEGLPFPVFHGGPCQAPGLILLHGHAGWQGSG